MAEQPEQRCDISNLLCQMQVLAHLRGIQNTLGDERFKSELPELANLSDTLTDKISTQERELEETMRSCGLLSEGEPASALEPAPFIEE